MQDKKKKEVCLFKIFYILIVKIAIPIIIPRTKVMTAKITTATMLIISAFSHPQSKKCLIKPSHKISNIIDAIIPEIKALKIAPIAVPNITIHKESMNLAFEPPTRIRPAIHRTGVSTKIFTIMLINIVSKLKVIVVTPNIISLSFLLI